MNHKIVQAIGRLKIGREGDVLAAAQVIRANATYEEQCEALERLPLQNPIVADSLFGIGFPTSWAQVWKHVPKRIVETSKALNWATAVMVHHGNRISDHVKQRVQIEMFALNGQWEKAQRTLDEHDRNFGPTLFSLRWRFLVMEEMEGAVARRHLLQNVRKISKGTVAGYFASTFSLLADSALTADVLRTSIIQFIAPQKKKLHDFLQFMFLEEIQSDTKIDDVLLHLEMLPLIDRYEFVLRYASHIHAAAHQDSGRLLKCIKRINEGIKDPALHYMKSVITGELDRPHTSASELVIKCWDAFMAADYRKANSLSLGIIQERPSILHGHELYVRSTMYLGKSVEVVNSPLSELHQALGRVFQKAENHDEALGYLLRFSMKFPIFELSASVAAFHATQWSKTANKHSQRLHALRAGELGPRNFETGFAIDANQDYLIRLRSMYPESIAVQFFLSICTGSNSAGETDFDAIPELRRLFFCGIAASKQGRYDRAKLALEKFLIVQEAAPAHPFYAFGVEEVRRALIDCYRLTGNIKKMQDLAVQMILQRQFSVRTLNMRSMWEACIENVAEVSRHIGFPIISHFACDDPHDISLALKRYLRHVQAQKPSEIRFIGSDSIEVKALLFTRVCTVDVLDSLTCLDVIEKAEAERIALLDWVIEEPNAFVNIAKNERMRLTQQAELRGALNRIDESRIVINVSSLREAQQEKFSEAYIRYASQRDAEGGTLKNKLLDVYLSTKTDMGHNLVPMDPVVAAFQEACHDVRKAFLYSPHFGLEACLSGRIRHGILVQQLLRPYSENRIIVREARDRTRAASYWKGVLNCADQELAQVISTLEKLTNKLDRLALEVRDVWIQSRTEAQNAEGLFDYRFSAEQLRYLQREIDNDELCEDRFLDRILDFLIRRTRENLVTVRRRITLELRRRLADGIECAIGEISGLGNGGSFIPLNAALIRCRQSVDQACQELTTWFHDSDTTLTGDSEMHVIAQTAIGMIKRLNPELNGQYELDVNTEFRVKGRHVNSFVYMLFFLLENSVKYSDVSGDPLFIKISIKAMANQLIVCVENGARSAADAQEKADKINVRIEELNKGFDPARVIREGGTGLAKVVATMQYEFKQAMPLFTARSMGDHVIVELRAKMEGIAA